MIPMTAGQGSGRFPAILPLYRRLLGALDQVEDRLKPRGDVAGFQQLLPLLDAGRQQRCDGVGQQAGIADVGKVETRLKLRRHIGVIDVGEHPVGVEDEA